MPPKRVKPATAVAVVDAETPTQAKPRTRAPKKAPSTDEDPDDKKRGRKPRGGKIVSKQQMTANPQPQPTNVVMNLKCSMADLKEYNQKLTGMISNPLEYNSAAPPEVKYYESCATQSFALIAQAEAKSEPSSSSSSSSAAAVVNNAICSQCRMANISNVIPSSQSTKIDYPLQLDDTDDKSVNMKEMSAKLKQLKIQLYKNSLQNDAKSACFWCTYDYDNSPCYIPKYEMDGVIYGYGSFCRPECAVAYLMKESIDDSTKFDRYHLLNQIYSKVYDCKKNIKPAPNPHYLLEKFYGNLTIQEYRKLLKTDHLLLVIDKPMTRILPELHEDTDDAFTKIYGIKTNTGTSSGVFKVKRQSEQPTGPSKASIIRNSFGLPS
jgi:hypothetical protein